MAFLEYMLLAVLGSAGTFSPGEAPARTFTAGAVTQPGDGKEGLLGQKKDTAKLSGSTENPTERVPRSASRRHVETRRNHRKVHKHTKTGGDPDRPAHRHPQA
jgi:hypothetical protein